MSCGFSSLLGVSILSRVLIFFLFYLFGKQTVIMAHGNVNGERYTLSETMECSLFVYLFICDWINPRRHSYETDSF